MAFLLRLEAVNFAAIFDDTTDLSTLRGSSLILLDTIKAVESKLGERYPGSLTTIARGGSAGLFRIDGDDRKGAEAFVRGLLGGRSEKSSDVLDLAGWATFLVATTLLADDNKFLLAREALEAKVRWQQMQSPRLVYGEPAADETAVCEADHVRPAKSRMNQRDWGAVSASVYGRRGYGLAGKKRTFYEERLKEFGWQLPAELPGAFAHRMEELDEPERPNMRRQLLGKIALIYADGNRFGTLERSWLANEEAGGSFQSRAQVFDGELRSQRAALLHSLLGHLAQRDGVGFGKEDSELDADRVEQTKVVRLETQLWGGDELIWAVPASLGHEVVRLLFEQTRAWVVGGRTPTHAVGVVFCHSNAPIARIRHLAAELAQACKEHSREEDLIAYEVMESFDHLGGDLEGYRRARYPGTVLRENLLLTPESWRQLGELIVTLEEDDFPRRQVRRLAQLLHRERMAGPLFERALGVLENEYKKEVERCEGLGLGPAAWLHLDALWDFAPPRSAETSRADQRQAT